MLIGCSDLNICYPYLEYFTFPYLPFFCNAPSFYSFHSTFVFVLFKNENSNSIYYDYKTESLTISGNIVLSRLPRQSNPHTFPAVPAPLPASEEDLPNLSACSIPANFLEAGSRQSHYMLFQTV